MASKKNLRWEEKNKDKDKKYGSGMRRTDYDIPSFGYKSSIIMILVLLVSVFLIPYIANAIGINPGWAIVILGGLIGGFTISYLQFKKEKKEKLGKNFILVGLLLSLLIGGIYYMLLRYGIFL